MNNSKICNNCGYDNSYTSSSIYCAKCGNKLDVQDNTEDNVIQNMDEQSEKIKNKKGNRLALVSLLLLFVVFEAIYLFRTNVSHILVEYVFYISLISSIIIAIVGRIKYPKNSFLKMLLIVYIMLGGMIYLSYLLIKGCVDSLKGCG